MAAARRANIARHIKAGWRYTNGLLVKGVISKRPTALMQTRDGTVMFNPLKDAFALRLGAEFVAPNRYRMGTLLLDRHGACAPVVGCPGCGSVMHEAAWSVRTESQNPNVPAWKQAFTYCRVCVAPVDVARARDKAVELRRRKEG